MRSLSRKRLSPYSVQRPRRLVRLAGQQRREVHLLGADRVHLLADDPLDVAEHAQPERQPGVDARARRGGCSRRARAAGGSAPRRRPGPRAGCAGTGSTCAAAPGAPRSEGVLTWVWLAPRLSASHYCPTMADPDLPDIDELDEPQPGHGGPSVRLVRRARRAAHRPVLAGAVGPPAQRAPTTPPGRRRCEHIHATPGFEHRPWPHPMSSAENLGDLEMHARHFEQRAGLHLHACARSGDDDVIGCVVRVPAARTPTSTRWCGPGSGCRTARRSTPSRRPSSGSGWTTPGRSPPSTTASPTAPEQS